MPNGQMICKIILAIANVVEGKLKKESFYMLDIL